MQKKSHNIVIALFITVFVITTSGCGTNIRQSVAVAEQQALSDMLQQLNDAKAKVDEFCGEGTAEAAAAENAATQLNDRFNAYQQASNEVVNKRNQKISNSEKVAELIDAKQDKNREITSATQQSNAYEQGDRGPYGLMLQKYHDDQIDFDNVGNIRTWATKLKESSYNHQQTAHAQFEALNNHPGATEDMVTRAEELKTRLDYEMLSIEDLWSNVFNAFGDADDLEEAFLQLASVEAKIQTFMLEIELLNIEAQLSDTQAKVMAGDGAIANAQTAYDQSKRAFDDAMFDASNALSTAKAKAIECAGTDVFADGTPFFPPYPPNWNSTFWDISSP